MFVQRHSEEKVDDFIVTGIGLLVPLQYGVNFHSDLLILATSVDNHTLELWFWGLQPFQ